MIWGTAGFLALPSGFFSNHVVTEVVGMVIILGSASAYLTSYVKSVHRAKKALEIATASSTLIVIAYGYSITGSLLLGVLGLFVAAIAVFALVTSYLLPRARGNSGATPMS